MPRYLAIAETLEREVRGAAPNTVLPTEELFAKRFAVSRVTIRRALDLLERAGLVSRQRGRGTTVSPPKVTRTLPFAVAEDDYRRDGGRLETQILEYIPDATPAGLVAERFRLSSGTSVGYLGLLRLVNDRVVSYERRYLHPKIARRFVPARIQQQPVLEVIQRLASMSVESFEWELDISPALHDAAKALGITPGTLVLVTTSTDYLKDGSPIQVNQTYYRIDRVRFRSTGGGLYRSAWRRRRGVSGPKEGE
jgi:GntR family transcriptional regulator